MFILRCRWCTVTTVISVIVLSACSRGKAEPPAEVEVGKSQQAGASQHNPCSLLTTTDVSSALGVSASPTDSLDGHSCSWDVDDPKSLLPRVSVDFSINMDTRALSDICDSSDQPVIGIGDQACYSEAGPLTMLDFRKGNHGYSLTVTANGNFDPTPKKDKIKSAEKEMAQKVLGRI